MTGSNVSSNSPRRAQRAGTALVLAAATALGGIALAAPAQAAQIGRADAEGASWGAGWDACRKKYPATRSIRDVGNSWGDTDGKSGIIWNCYNTRNAT
jgi:hypothetical protein